MRTPRWVPWSLALAFAGAAAACRDHTLVRGPLQLTTDSASYVAVESINSLGLQRFDLSMVVRLENRGSTDVILQQCTTGEPTPAFGVAMAAIANDWASAYMADPSCVAAPPLMLRAGETRIDTLWLVGPRAYDGETLAPLGFLEGTMRIVYFADGVPLASNAFEVRVGQ